MKKLSTRFGTLLLTIVLIFSITPVKTNADVMEELFGISVYYFHYLNNQGNIQNESFHNVTSKDKAENGIFVKKTGFDRITVEISAWQNEQYLKCKPVLMWMHKADSLFDVTKYTDKEKWFQNKLEETFLICEIPDYTQDSVIEVHVPIKLNIGLVGLINGGYYEIEFYGEGAIPEQLQFAYKAQSYSLEELEEYMQTEMADNISDYYNVDSGFRPNKDGLPFRNSDFTEKGGVCGGISSITTAKYNGYEIDKTYKNDDVNYAPDDSCTWYDYVYGNKCIHDIVLNDEKLLHNNSPSKNMIDDKTSEAYELSLFKKFDENDMAFYSLLKSYNQKNSVVAFLKGNTRVLGVKFQNLENRWSIIDYVASYLRQGKAFTVNISTPESGHAVVGYKMEQIESDTYRLYCYDSNFPDDMMLVFKNGAPQNYESDDSGKFENIVMTKTDVYIDFKKSTRLFFTYGSPKEYDVFSFNSENTSIRTTSEDGGMITFSLCKGDNIGVFNYGSESNEIIAYKAFPVILDSKTVMIRTFAYYKSGEVIEITNSCDTTVKTDLNYLGWYKIKDSKITLTKKDYEFKKTGSTYVECVVSYFNYKGTYGQIKVRVPIGE